jgi:uncharacterized RDD family membrane protein YckC
MAARAAPPPPVWSVITPEGVPLPFVVAAAADRVYAFVLDALILLAATVVVWLLCLVIFLGVRGLGLALALLATFALRNAYFVACEANWSGRTLGKRAAGLRVIARDGGPLTAEAVLARNLTRELEVFMPLTVLLVGRQLAPELPGWALAAASLWLFAFALLPLASRERLRCGDLAAGTMVVRAPRAVLLADLAAAPGAAIAFTREQLDVYGIQELQVLEDLLRRRAEGTLGSGVLDEVAGKIRRKIGWQPHDPAVPAETFLRAFYGAQRGRLEQRLLFGERRERKR